MLDFKFYFTEVVEVEKLVEAAQAISHEPSDYQCPPNPQGVDGD